MAETKKYVVTFALTIRDKTIPEPQTGEPILIPLQRRTLLMELVHNQEFRIETKDVPRGGPYLVSVNGVRNGPDKFWDVVLYNPKSKEVRPINLDYIPGEFDNVILRFSYF